MKDNKKEETYNSEHNFHIDLIHYFPVAKLSPTDTGGRTHSRGEAHVDGSKADKPGLSEMPDTPYKKG